MLVVPVNLTLVAVLVAVTVTFGTAEPLASSTLPTRSPLMACAGADGARQDNATTSAKTGTNGALCFTVIRQLPKQVEGHLCAI
jgi:hypothetical protein